MLRDRYEPMNVFDLVPALGLTMDPVLMQHCLLDHVVELAQTLKVTRGRTLRMDGTVVETPLHHPTDSPLLYDGVRVLGRTLAKARAILQQTSGVAREALRDRTRSAKCQMKRIMEAARQRGTEAADRMRTAYQRLLTITQTTVQHAPRVGAVLTAQATAQGKKLAATVTHLVPLVCQVISQTTRRVLQGEVVPAAEKVVSLFEPQTAIIRKGKPGRPTEFGRVIWLDEVEGGIVSRYAVLEGNPAEDAQLPPSLEHHLRVFKQPPRLLTGDRGVHSAAMETLISLGRLLQWRAVFDHSLGYLHEGVELARLTHAGFLFGQATIFIGYAYTAKGAYEDALRWYQQLSDYASKAGDAFWLARVPNVIGGVHLDVFDLDEALRLNLEGEEVALQFYPWPEPRGHSLVKAGLAHLYRGEHGPAQACFHRAETLLEEDTWLRWRWHIALLHAFGELALIQGHHDQAWFYATQSLELATQTDSRKHVVRAQRLQGDILAASGRLAEAAQALATSVQLAEQLQTPREVWLGKAALGKVLARRGRDKEAEAQLTQATQTIEAIAANLRTPRLHQSFLGAAPVVEIYQMLEQRPPAAMP
jgi:IS5 family transposase